MQRIGFQRLTVVLRRNAPKGAGAPGVDRDRKEHDQEGSHGRLNLHAVKEQTPHRFIDDPDAGHQQQTGFDEGGKILKLAVSVLVIGIRRLIGNPHRKKCHQGCDQIQSRMCGLR